MSYYRVVNLRALSLIIPIITIQAQIVPLEQVIIGPECTSVKNESGQILSYSCKDKQDDPLVPDKPYYDISQGRNQSMLAPNTGYQKESAFLAVAIVISFLVLLAFFARKRTSRDK